MGIRDFILDSVLRNWPGGHAVPAGGFAAVCGRCALRAADQRSQRAFNGAADGHCRDCWRCLELHNWYRLFGEKLFSNPNSKIFRRSYLDKTHSFYERHGGKTIILARFVPIVRTFAPFVAGMGHMSYRHFAMYNVVGALLWVLLFTYAGYLFGDLPIVQENLKLLIVAIIVLSVLPGVIEVIRHKRAAAKQAK